MNIEQIKKWNAIREKGRTSYLLKRTLLWGTILSFLEICRSELLSYLYARRLAKITVNMIFGSNGVETPVNPVTDFLTSHFSDVSNCLLLAGCIALAVWTYKEQSYYASITPEANQP
jgi:hypothetical protein